MSAVLWLLYRWKYDPFPCAYKGVDDRRPVSPVPLPLILAPLSGVHSTDAANGAVEQLVDPLKYVSWTLTWQVCGHDSYAWRLPDGRVIEEDSVYERLVPRPGSGLRAPPESDEVRYDCQVGVEYRCGPEVIGRYDFAWAEYVCPHCRFKSTPYRAYPQTEDATCEHCKRRVDRRAVSGFPAYSLRRRGYLAALRLVGDAAADPFKKRRKGGRPPDRDANADAKLAEAWESGQYRTHAELARAMKEGEREVKLALERHRKRQGRKS